MSSFVFDSNALIFFLETDKRGELIEKILEDCSEGRADAYLCTVNLGEIYYHAMRTGGEQTAKIALDAIRTMPVKIEDAGYELSIEAAKIKANNRMAYADCFAAALAIHKKAFLVTGDKEFKQLEKKIKIKWI